MPEVASGTVGTEVVVDHPEQPFTRLGWAVLERLRVEGADAAPDTILRLGMAAAGTYFLRTASFEDRSTGIRNYLLGVPLPEDADIEDGVTGTAFIVASRSEDKPGSAGDVLELLTRASVDLMHRAAQKDLAHAKGLAETIESLIATKPQNPREVPPVPVGLQESRASIPGVITEPIERLEPKIIDAPPKAAKPVVRSRLPVAKRVTPTLPQQRRRQAERVEGPPPAVAPSEATIFSLETLPPAYVELTLSEAIYGLIVSIGVEEREQVALTMHLGIVGYPASADAYILLSGLAKLGESFKSYYDALSTEIKRDRGFTTCWRAASYVLGFDEYPSTFAEAAARFKGASEVDVKEAMAVLTRRVLHFKLGQNPNMADRAMNAIDVLRRLARAA